MLAFRRDFKEAAGVFAVGIVAVLLATPAGVSLLRDTVSSLFGASVMEVRSYRRVFDLERRIYSIDRMRLNPSGVPLRGVVYFLVLAARRPARRAAAGRRRSSARSRGSCVTSALPAYSRRCSRSFGSTDERSTSRPSRWFVYHVRPRRTRGARAALAGRTSLAPAAAADARRTAPIRAPGASATRGPGVVLVRVAHERRGARRASLGGVAGRAST